MKVITIIIIIIIALGAAWVGLSLWSGGCAGPENNRPDMPNEDEATHSFYIENTGGLILATDFEQHGQEIGSRTFVLHGFWELRGKEFKFIDGDIVLDEHIFGDIAVKRRMK